MASRVVPAISETTNRSSPSSRLTNDDFPTFGRPTTATRKRRFALGLGMRQPRDDSVEQIARPLAVDRRHREDHVGAELVELVKVGRARIVHLVGDEHPRLAANCAAAPRRDDRSDAGRLRASTTNKQKIRFPDRFVDLAADLPVHWRARIVGDAAGVDEPEWTPCPLRLSEVPIARRAGLLRHDRGVVLDDAVEERGFADVRSADQCHDWNAHAAAPSRRAAPVPSCVRTSTKSYDGYTGMENSSRTAMNGSSSRNRP